MVELEELVRLASCRGKFVVLLVGPCGLCGMPKTAALRPLLRVPALRLFTHLVMDLKTAEELCPPGSLSADTRVPERRKI